jgi:uncharacterized protein YuzE
MRLEYDPEVDAAYVRLRGAAVVGTEEIAPGVMMDLAADGRPAGFEILDASEVFDGRPQGVTFELVSRALASRR